MQQGSIVDEIAQEMRDRATDEAAAVADRSTGCQRCHFYGEMTQLRHAFVLRDGQVVTVEVLVCPEAACGMVNAVEISHEVPDEAGGLFPEKGVVLDWGVTYPYIGAQHPDPFERPDAPSAE